MPINYNKMLDLFKERNETSYTLTKKNKVIGQATWKKINDGGHIDTRSIEALCKYFNCQPGDLMEYTPDDAMKKDNTPDTAE
jgi:putative transcriptional regulator